MLARFTDPERLTARAGICAPIFVRISSEFRDTERADSYLPAHPMNTISTFAMEPSSPPSPVGALVEAERVVEIPQITMRHGRIV